LITPFTIKHRRVEAGQVERDDVLFEAYRGVEDRRAGEPFTGILVLTPARIGAVIAAVLFVVALAYLVSLPQNQFQPADLLEPKYAADADLGYWMVYEYDPEVDVYHLLVVMQHDNGTFEWLDGDGIWLPRRAVEGTFNVIGSFDRRKAHL